MRKLGGASAPSHARIDSRSIGSSAPDHLELSWLELDGERFAVLSYPLGPRAELAALTPAEREIVELVVAGKSNAEVAARRETSTHTVANQMAAIFRKLGVGSRRELVALITTRTGRIDSIR